MREEVNPQSTVRYETTGNFKRGFIFVVKISERKSRVEEKLQWVRIDVFSSFSKTF